MPRIGPSSVRAAPGTTTRAGQSGARLFTHSRPSRILTVSPASATARRSTWNRLSPS